MQNPFREDLTPQAPWHMWGTTKLLEPNADFGGGNTASTQMVRINYKRPETWSFFFGGQLLAASTPAANQDVILLFDLIIGAGRTLYNTEAQGNILTVPGFARMVWRVVPPYVPSADITNRKYTTVASGPPLDDTVVSAGPTIEWVPGQDIQVNCRARVSGPAGSTATVEATAWFAPRSHIRPEWFSEEYRGGEIGGT